MSYPEEEYLMISGLQHFCFCRRQWALIHVEQQWQENVKTVEGNIVHENCHDEKFNEKRINLIITRGMRVSSSTLGVSGQCDVVEFYSDLDGAILTGRSGFWRPYPVEYKRGRSKLEDEDRLQLCCQAMCLEEMLSTDIKEGAVFYNETHRREKVIFDNALREKVKTMLKEMHDYFSRGYTPKVKPKKGCSSCSLSELCMPKICGNKKVSDYYINYLEKEGL